MNDIPKTFKVLALSSKILVFLSHHTTHIKARQANYHNTFPLMVLPNSVYEMVIMSHTYRRKPVQMTAHMPTCYFKINQNDAHVLYTGVTRCLGTFTRRKRTSVHYRIVVFAKSGEIGPLLTHKCQKSSGAFSFHTSTYTFAGLNSMTFFL